MEASLSWRDLLKIRIQKMISYFFLPFICLPTILWMRWIRGYQFPNIQELRKEFKQIQKLNKEPLILCSNHLTLIDSFLLLWVFVPFFKYFTNFKLFFWNIPEKKNFWENFFIKIYCYIGKCIPIERGGASKNSLKVLKKISYLLNKGDSVLIFPEGTRSRTGKIDLENRTYGIGKILRDIPNSKVLCIYLRGMDQNNYSNIPAKNNKFFCKIELFHPQTTEKGRRADRELSLQVLKKLQKMEEEFFTSNYF